MTTGAVFIPRLVRAILAAMAQLVQDIALVYDPVRRRADVVFSGTDFQLDATPQTALIMSLGCDRRANADDELPTGLTDLYGPAPVLNPRRGWPGDAFDALGRLIGSRLWLLFGRKADELTRRLAETATAEAVGWIETARGLTVQVLVRYVAKGVLGIQVSAGATTLRFQRAVAA